MKLTFKDLKQQKFVIEAEPTDTIGSVKDKISSEKGWEVSTQKLIYSGKILQDDKTVEDYKIEEKGFIVCMIQKPKAAPAPVIPPSTPATGSASTPAPPQAPVQPSNVTVPASNAPGTPTPSTNTTAETPAVFNDPSALAIGSQRATAIANMESMGFERAQIDRAMRAAYNNPDRAVEYLISGIPENAQQEEAPRPPRPAAPAAGTTGGAAIPQTNTTATPAPAEAATGGDDAPINLFEAAAQAGRGGTARGTGARQGAGAAGTAAANNLDFLRNNPQFQQLRQIVQTQPQMLEPILQQVGAGNPQLAEMIGQNPEQFLQLLSEDADEDAPLPPGAQAVSVTEEERDAIERLCNLGFDRDLAIQAYFACDKNEDLAANFLFDQPPDEDEQN